MKLQNLLQKIQSIKQNVLLTFRMCKQPLRPI